MAAKKKDLTTELIDDILQDGSSLPDDAGLIPPELEEEIRNHEVSRHESDKTEKLSASKILTHPSMAGNEKTSGEVTERSIRTSVGRYAVKSVGARSATDAHLIQSENLRVAQEKIFQLEEEISRLRTENEQLVAAAETLRTENDSLSAEAESKTQKLERLKETVAQEREVFEVSSKAKDRELRDLRSKMSEFEKRLSTNIQKIRVRERELENRLELVKMETAALTRNKDEMLLDLKRQIDHLNLEIQNYRGKSQQLNKQLSNQQEVLRKTVKALRLALSMLEGEVEEDAS